MYVFVSTVCTVHGSIQLMLLRYPFSEPFDKISIYVCMYVWCICCLGTSYVNELDSVKALETLRAWITHNPRFQGLKVTADEYSDGTLMDEVTSSHTYIHKYI